MSHVFISYSRKDQTYARKLADDLLEQGFDVWLDDKIQYGENWERMIFKAIDTCSVFVVIMTPDSYESDWVLREIQYADKRKKPQLPLLLAGEEFPRYGPTQFVDVRGERLPSEEFHIWLSRYAPHKATRGEDVITLNFPPPALPQYSDSQVRELMNLIDDPRTEPEERAETGRKLADMGDPRPGIGLRMDGTPDIEWIKVSPGPFPMGSDKKRDSLARDHELPRHTPDTRSFYIARYPVTYAQFEAFVQCGAYQINRYWTKEGLDWREEKTHPSSNWQDSQWHISNHPVVGITWYEAVAFASWMNELHDGDLQIAGQPCTIRLPTETEWEKAARGIQERIYPWGNTFHPSQANTFDTGLGRTTAVGIFPQGESPYGVLDMCGNVWEWCASAWRKNYKTPEDNDPQAKVSRVLRGGSFLFYHALGRCTSRSHHSPAYKDDFVGFRLCASTNSL